MLRLQIARIVLAAAALALLAVRPASAQQQPVRGEATVTTAGGYGRIVIRFAGEVESQVRLSGNILIVQFKQPVDVPVDRLGAAATEYIGAARRDPDGRGLRFALAQKVKLSSMVAGERLFIDLLPETWQGEAPSLPREVVEELAHRAQDAEKLARQRLLLEQQSKMPPVRVRIAAQPTFTRYVFELPELTGVTAERGKDKLVLSFTKPLRFDLADAKLSLPKSIEAIDASRDTGTAEVRFRFAQQADVRTFREDSNYVVDVSPLDAKAGAALPLEGLIPPAVIPAKPPETQPSAPAVAPQVAETKPEPAAAPTEPPKQQAAPAPAAPRDPNRLVVAELHRRGDSLRVYLPFAGPTPAAVFQRADTLWLVFDTRAKLDLSVLADDHTKTVHSVAASTEDGAQVVRIKLERPRLVSLEPQDHGWLISIGDSALASPRPLIVARNVVVPGRASITIPFDGPQHAHWLSDPEIGDKLLVITGLGPPRGLVKDQNFVELRALASVQGIAVQPIADDLKIELAADKVLLMRPEGLTLSEAAAPRIVPATRAVTFDTKLWSIDRDAEFNEREFALLAAAAAAPFTHRTASRLAVARFYFSRQMYAEAKGVLDATIADDKPTKDDPSPLVLRAAANIMLGRVDEAQKDLADPAVGDQNDAPLWRAIALARDGKWSEAHDAFRGVEGALAALPLELQRIALKDALRASIETGDVAGATARLNDFKTIGVPADLEPEISLLTGRLAERSGRSEDALTAYRFAAGSADRPVAAQARLREIALRYKEGDLKKAEVIDALEGLTAAWRGDATEVEALRMLARLYTGENRYREAFHVMRVALSAYPQSPYTVAIQKAAGQTFDGLFLAGRADALPAIDALSLFYDFRDLTPIGRRGDDMIRRLAERLVSVDLLDQAAELLKYQVDNRLQGAARAQVATRLAVIDLLNHKPDKAQAVLRATRTADLANEIRIPRLLIEARALSELGRHDFALDIIAGIDGRESLRLRADIYWAERNWQKAAEHLELLYGDRWKSFEPLTDTERMDILRAAVAYALAADKIGLGRLRDKYAAKMAEGPDRRAFELITGGVGPTTAEFREVARYTATADTLTAFLRDLKARYPEMSGALDGGPAPAPRSTKPDPRPTGSLRRVSRRRSPT